MHNAHKIDGEGTKRTVCFLDCYMILALVIIYGHPSQICRLPLNFHHDILNYLCLFSVLKRSYKKCTDFLQQQQFSELSDLEEHRPFLALKIRFRFWCFCFCFCLGIAIGLGDKNNTYLCHLLSIGNYPFILVSLWRSFCNLINELEGAAKPYKCKIKLHHQKEKSKKSNKIYILINFN